ncbi:FAD:protein FMN transferase [Ensifer soli]|uniref:FAD:protein FMN transferase n=1 Tax=Ciceribacter sp. sgz301302 TaxID=3342379 RepID=UPI0035B9D988
MRRRRFLAICATVPIAGAARASVTRWQAEALGGLVSVDLRGPRPLADEVGAAIAATIAEIEAAASLFRADSALSRLNAAGRLDDPPTALVDLLHLGDRVHRDTGGRFDPTVQPLWRALAEGRDTAAARAAIGWHRVVLAPSPMLGPGQALTFNGIAQGYAADRVRNLLKTAGYRQVLIDMGEFAAIGGPFAIGVEDPAEGLVATRSLDGTAIATSSPAAMRLGEAFHILAPDGRPPLWSTVSVEARSAALADGFSTAFCLMPAEEIRATLRRVPELLQVTAVDPAGDLSTF